MERRDGRRAAAAVFISLLCVTGVLLVMDTDNNRATTHEEVTGAGQHNPAVIEAQALQAVSRTRKAAQALESTRKAVVRMQQLGNTVGAATALRAEQDAKRAFIKARQTSEPLVAEARANYEANQGSEIQAVAKQVAQDTWRTMTSSPLAHTSEVDEAVYGDSMDPLSDRMASRSSREHIVNRAALETARDYAGQAHQSQIDALRAQMKMDGNYPSDKQKGRYPQPHPGLADPNNPAMNAVARYAKQAHDAMQATKAAQDSVQKQLDEIKKERAALAAAQAKNATEAGKKVPAVSKEASEVISGAEADVSAAMHVVENAATTRGMKDNSWKSRIGDMIKDGRAAEADQAAKQYVQKSINHAISAQVQSGPVDTAASQVANAQAAVNAAAAKVGAPAPPFSQLR